MLCGDEQSTCERERHPPANRGTVQRADHRLLEIPKFSQARKAARTVISVPPAVELHLPGVDGLQVPTRREDLFATPGDDPDDQFGVVAQLREGLPQRDARRQIDRIHGRSIQRDFEYTAAPLNPY